MTLSCESMNITNVTYDTKISNNQNINHFAEGLNFYKLFWVFTIGAFSGVIVETLWGLIKLGSLECRSSLILGPFNVVYGFGALLLYLGLRNINIKNISAIFIFGIISGSVVEYLCSWLQEMAFGTVSWDYSNLPLNIGGRVCLLYSFFWGALAILWVKFLQPQMENLIYKIPNSVGKQITWFLSAFLVVSTIFSITAVTFWVLRLHGTANYGTVAQLFYKILPNSRMEQLYPNMQF